MAVNDLSIPCCYCWTQYHEGALDLIMFSNASKKAFGAVGYLRFEWLDRPVNVSLVMTKTKVAPVKYVSVPCLELYGCLMSVRMATTIIKELCFKIL
jgi:hypothetical protein